jgi:hypothetical protein
MREGSLSPTVRVAFLSTTMLPAATAVNLSRIMDLIAGYQSSTATCLLGRVALVSLLSRRGRWGEVEEWAERGRRETGTRIKTGMQLSQILAPKACLSNRSQQAENTT